LFGCATRIYGQTGVKENWLTYPKTLHTSWEWWFKSTTAHHTHMQGCDVAVATTNVCAGSKPAPCNFILTSFFHAGSLGKATGITRMDFILI